jgi:NitT/TauT family transport system ATP-binding protein
MHEGNTRSRDQAWPEILADVDLSNKVKINMSQPKICLKDVTKTYRSTTTDVVAIKNVNIEVMEHEIFTIVGPSGCGKTTVLNMVGGFISPTSGQHADSGKPVTGPNGKCGVVFQDPSVFPWMTVEDNVGYGLSCRRIEGLARDAVIQKYLSLIGLEEFARSWPRELSGGMKKRVELARTYAFNPEVLLLDEPFGGLDVFTKEEMHMLLLKIWQTERKSILFVTHDVEEAVFMGHRVGVMTRRPGSIKQEFVIPFGMPRELSLKLTPEFIDIRRKVVESLKN